MGVRINDDGIKVYGISINEWRIKKYVILIKTIRKIERFLEYKWWWSLYFKIISKIIRRETRRVI
jgi:hypothetical protein